MSDNKQTPSGTDMSQVMHSIGQLTGAVKAMHEGTTARIEDIRNDIRRLEQSTNDRMTRTEAALSGQIRDQSVQLNKAISDQGDQLNKRIDGVNTRVTSLEAEDKKLIEKTARLGAIGGGVGGALAAGLVELIKRM